MRTYAVLLLLSGAFNAAADEAEKDKFQGWEDTPVTEADMYESEVIGYRIRATDEVTGFAETIDLKEQSKTAADLSDILSNAVGVQVRTMGGLGAYSAVSVRGSTPDQVPVFLDGIQLNIGGSSAVNLGDFSLDTLESVEIYRGNAPLSIGTSGIGGAIVLRTRHFEEPVLEYAASLGSWNTWRIFTLYGGRVGKTEVLAVVSGQHSDGNFLYYNRNGTFNTSDNTEDDEFVRRSNNDYTAYSALLKLNRKAGFWNIQLTDDFFDKNQGLAGIDYMVDKSDATLDTLRNAVSLRAERSFGDKSLIDLDLAHLFLFEHFNDMSGTIGTGNQEAEYRTHGASFAALLKTEFSQKHITTFRLSERYEHFAENRLHVQQEDRQSPSHRLKTELGAEHEWIPAAPLHIVPTLRGELHYSYFGGGSTPALLTDFKATSKTDFFFSPSLGIRYDVLDGLVLRADGGRYTRTPNLSELFGDRGSVLGNPDLKAEAGCNVDAGATYILAGKSHLDLLQIDAAWFASWVKDLISFEQNSQSTITPVNIDAAVIQGAEVDLRLSMFQIVTLSGNYTYFYGVNRSAVDHHRGKKLPGRPTHEAYGRIEIGKMLTDWGLAFWFDTDYAGKAYVAPYNSENLVTMHFFLGAGSRFDLPQIGLTLTFEVKNLLDTLVFKNNEGAWLSMSDYNRYPLPGRAFMGTVHWKIP